MTGLLERPPSLSGSDIRPLDEPTPGSRAAPSMAQNEVRYQPAPSSPIDLVSGLAPDSRSTFERMVRRLLEFTALPVNWDSYGGLPLDPAVALAALRLLLPLVASGAPMPFLVPRSAGGLSLEWHSTGRELILSLEGPTTVSTYFWDPQSGEEWEVARADDRFLAALTKIH